VAGNTRATASRRIPAFPQLASKTKIGYIHGFTCIFPVEAAPPLAKPTGQLFMANRIVDRRALREEAEAAEKLGTAKKKAAPKRKAAKRKTKAKEPVEVRVKLFWGVFNQSLKRVATFEYHDKKAAEARREELDKAGKSTHFVRKFKEVLDEA
jgi:hypothetical protein